MAMRSNSQPVTPPLRGGERRTQNSGLRPLAGQLATRRLRAAVVWRPRGACGCRWSRMSRYQDCGFENVPMESVKVEENWHARNTLELIVAMWDEETAHNSRLMGLKRCGLITFTGQCASVATIFRASARSLSFEIMAASVKSRTKQSRTRYTPRLTSEPFSSVFSTCTA